MERVGSGGQTGGLVCPVLVGRDDLMELASRRLAAARDGHGHLLFLAGEAGIGKTRLLRVVERRAERSGYRVIEGGAFPRDLEVAAAPLLDLGRAMTRHPDLAAGGTALVDRLSREEIGTGDAHRRRRLLILDVVDVLIAAADAAPLLVAFEDLHWSDDLTLEILGAVARRLAQVPLVVVATYRSDELYPRVPMREWRARLLAARQAEEARLRRLSPDETATMTRLLLGADRLAPTDLMAAVHARTDGIPLHVEELLGLLLARDPDAADGISAIDVPDTLDAAILDRLERRSSAARDVARAASVIGRSFGLPLLAGISGFTEEDLDRALTELRDHFFIQPTNAPDRFDFRHALIRDAIYNHVPPSLRRRSHERVAELAPRLGEVSDSVLSAHFEEAGRRDDAHRTALAAARAAAALHAHREALELFRRAARNVRPDLPAAAHGRLLAELGAAAAAADDNPGAVDAFAAARERFSAAGDVVAAADILVPLVAARHLIGDGLEQRVGLLSEGVAEVADRQDEGAVRTRARILAGLSAAYMLDRRLDASIEHGEKALELAERGDDEATILNARTTLASCFVFAGRMDEGWHILEKAISVAREAHREAEAARAFRMIGSSASVLVEYARAERFLREGIEFAERIEAWNHHHYMAAHLGHVLWATGRWEEADVVARRALADGRGGVTTRITALHVLGYVALGHADTGAARTALEEARELGMAMGELQRLSPALWGLAELALLEGDPAAAIAWCEEGRAASAVVDDAAYLFPFVVTGTRAHLELRDPAAADQWVTMTAAALRRRSIPGTLPAIGHAEGLLALARGATGRARTLLEVAVSEWRARDRAWEGTAALVDLADCHRRANRRREATRLADEARAMAARMGARSLLARADATLRAIHGRAGGEEPWSPLTMREFEVARLVAAGETNLAIASALGISPRTVGAHIEHILAKLGASRRAEIATWTTTRVRERIE